MPEKTKEILDEIELFQWTMKDTLNCIATIPAGRPGPWILFYEANGIQYAKFAYMKNIKNPLIILTSYDVRNGLSRPTWARLENKIRFLIKKGTICPEPSKP